MKILYLSFADISGTSGPSVNERQFIPALYNLIGEKAHFLIPKPKNEVSSDIPLDRISFFTPSKQNGKRSAWLWVKQQYTLIKQANKLLKNGNFDMMIIRAGIFPFAINYIVGKHKIPYALKTAGDGQFSVFKRKNILLRSLYGINQSSFRKLVDNAILVDVVSIAQRDTQRKYNKNPDKTIWIDNGVDLNRFKPKPKEELKIKINLSQFNPIIGYVGNYPWERGAMQVVEAISELKKTYPNIGGLIVGSGDKMHLLHDKAKELNVEDNLIFTGQVDFELVPDYINLMDVAVSQRYENTQSSSELKVRQYLACGKPIVVTPGGNDFVKNESFCIITSPTDKSEFFKAVNHFLSMDSTTYEKVSNKALVYAKENLSYESKVLERLNLYKEILNK